MYCNVLHVFVIASRITHVSFWSYKHIYANYINIYIYTVMSHIICIYI